MPGFATPTGRIDKLFEVDITSNAFGVAKQLSQAGFGNLGLHILKNAVNDIAELGLNAAKSKVPIDTGELRNEKLERSKASLASLQSYVYVSSSIHYGRRKQPKGADQLAAWLEYGGKRRSQYSHAVAPFSSVPEGTPHRYWIEKAQAGFLLHLNRHVAGSIYY